MARRFQDWRSLPVMPVTEADRSVILGCKVEVVLGTPIIIEPLSAIIGERAGVDDEEFMSLLHGKLRAQARRCRFGRPSMRRQVRACAAQSLRC